MRMRSHRGAVEEQMLGVRQIAGHNQKDCRPIARSLPAPKALIDGVPIAKPGRKITPRNSCPRDIKNRLDKIAIRQDRRRTRGMLHRVKRLGNSFPDFIAHPHENAVHGDLQLKFA